ncbi:MAG: glycosyltransferase family 2 protein [Thermoguttaceae bacterium]
MATVSVIIPTYNRAQFICESLGSVFAQTYQDFEIIVVDDGSTDNTEEVLAPYMDRIRYVKQENCGAAIARNRGIFLSTGKYIAFLDSDDMWYPTKLEKQVAVLEENDSVGFVYCNGAYGKSPDSLIAGQVFSKTSPPSGYIFNQIAFHNTIWTPSILIRREVFIKSGVFDPTLRRVEDYDLWLRICYFFNGVFIPEALFFVREHTGRISNHINHELSCCRSLEIQTIRWAEESEASGYLLNSAKKMYLDSAWKYRIVGDFKNAIYCFKKAASLVPLTIKERAKFFLLRYVPIVFRWYDRKTNNEQSILK